MGYAPGAEKPAASTNHRNGVTAKTVLTGDGKLRIETPRDRDGSFEPLLLPKHARRFTAFDDSIVALYARGLTVREIQGYLAEAYGAEVGHDLISTVTDGVLAEVSARKAAGNIVQIVDLVLSRIGDIAAGRNSFIAINPDVVDRIRKAPQEALQ